MKVGKLKVDMNKEPKSLEDVDLSLSLEKAEYQKRLKDVQELLLRIQQAYYRQGRRAIIVFEGWDAAGKGGSIRRLTEKLDPRGFRVYPISAPRSDEQGRHYLYRFYKRLPKPGTIAIFDRSWYGRVLVERVEKFASKPEWKRAYQEINEFERMLADDNVRIVKLFLHIDEEEQLKRFELRLRDPVKRWKLTEEDLRNRRHWKKYHKAINQMVEKTSVEYVPWYLVSAKHKWYARVRSLEIIAHTLAKDVDISLPPLDEELVKAAEQQLGIRLTVE